MDTWEGNVIRKYTYETESKDNNLGGRHEIRNRAMLTVGIHLALRASELCGLMVGDVYDGKNVRSYTISEKL